MSPISEALHRRFDAVCRAELERLRRKTAGLPASARAEVDAMSVEIMQAIAHRLEAVLDTPHGEHLAGIVAHLFAVPTAISGSPR